MQMQKCRILESMVPGMSEFSVFVGVQMLTSFKSAVEAISVAELSIEGLSLSHQDSTNFTINRFQQLVGSALTR
jgi:hypothetical protein